MMEGSDFPCFALFDYEKFKARIGEPLVEKDVHY